MRLNGKLQEIKNTIGIDVLIFEAARNAGPKMQGALVVQAELQGVIVLWCEQNKVEYRGLSPTEIKRYATGKGNAGKPQMISAARSKWPNVIITDDNTADALWILDYAQKTFLQTLTPVPSGTTPTAVQAPAIVGGKTSAGV
jgi:Holliday junction resolvasome RuvABC endonuclease subunit